MPLSVRNLITNALITCDAIAIGETPDDAEIARGLQKFNDIVSQLSLDNLWNYTFAQQTFTLIAGQKVYTIGDGTNPVDIVANVPSEIVNLSLLRANIWHPIEVVSETEFDSRVRYDTGINDTPYVVTYRREHPDAKLEFYPIPGTEYNVRYSTRDMKIEYTLDDLLDLPPGYNGYLEYALAGILAVDYGRDPSALAQIASTRLGNIKRQNHQPRKLRYEAGVGQGRYDINSDTYYGGN